MADYAPLNFVDGTYPPALSAASFNHMDQGIAAAVRKDTITTKGDLLVGTGASAVARVGIGADGTVLGADSSASGGVAWVPRGLPVIDVTFYGAKGDGATDDTTAIQNALNAVPASGALVYFPVGKYLVPNGGLTCANTVSILGAGTGTYETASGGSRLLCSSTTATLLTLSAPGSVVTGVTFENTATVGSSTAGAGLLCSDFDWGRVERCMFIGFWNQLQVDVGYFYSIRDTAFLRPVNYGAYMRNTASGQYDHGDQVLEGCNFSKYGDSTNGGTAVRWESGGGLRLIGCKVNAGEQPGYPSTGFWDRGFHTYLTPAGSTSVHVISGCSVEGYYLDAIRIEGASGASFGKIAVTGCEFLASASNSNVVYADGNGMTLNSITITGNVAYGSGGGVNLKNLSRAVVVGNEFGGVAQTAVQLTNVDKVRVAGNQVETSYIDNDANDGSSAVGQSRDPWRYARDFTGLTTASVQYGGLTPGLYSASVVTITVHGNTQTVGGFFLKQSRQITRTTGAVTVGSTVGTDQAFGPGAAEVSITWDVATSPFLRPRLTSVNGKTCYGTIDVTVEGACYQLSYANI